jgi:hypothetical protein
MSEYARVIRDGKPSDALVIHCSDPDFQKTYRDYVASLGIGKYDPIVEPGPSKFIVQDENLPARVRVLKNLHNFERAVILDHINCGAFGIPEESAEIAKHFQYAKLANEVLMQTVPGLVVEYHLLGWDSEILDPKASIEKSVFAHSRAVA